MQGVSGKKLHDIYITSWKSGLKTTYYLRTLVASQIEKSTLDASKFGFTQKRIYKADTASHSSDNNSEQSLLDAEAIATDDDIVEGKTCSISSDPECEVCQ